jgi:N-acetylglucosamine kinase-like BadF-type ATPase
MYVLGIDGGGTKTTGIVADEIGNVYMQAFTGRSNANTLSKDEFKNVISGLLMQLKNQNIKIYNQISVCFAGIAGIGECGREVEVSNLLSNELPTDTKIHVRNDAFNALYSGTLGEAGIVQISGTGTITFGLNKEQKMIRSGGWGYLFDDEGSGFYLGNEALRAVFREFDYRGPTTSLTTRLLNYFKVQTVPEIIDKVYGEEHPRSIIAPLAKIVVEESVVNDKVAKNILLNACKEMMLNIVSCHNQLFEAKHPTTIVLSGGVFTDSELFIRHFEELANEALPNVVFQETQVPPVGGAVIAGLKLLGLAIDKQFLTNLNEQIQCCDDSTKVHHKIEVEK